MVRHFPHSCFFFCFFNPRERKHSNPFHPPNSLVRQKQELKKSKVQLISSGHSVTFLQRGRWADNEARGFKWNHPQSQLWQDRDEGSSGDEKISKTKNYELRRRRRFIRSVKGLWGTRIKGTWTEGDGYILLKKNSLLSFLLSQL